MAKHIGIVGCSAPGTALCYETICTEGARVMGRKYAHPEISVHAHPFDEYMRLAQAGHWEAVGELMLLSAKKLAKVGADFVISPVNLMHQGLDLVIARSPLPWLHIATEVARAAKKRGCQRLALLGTRALMEGPVYPPKLAAEGIEYRIPKAEESERANAFIFGEMVLGKFTEEARTFFVGLMERMRTEEGCDAVGMCCTELPLLVRPEDVKLPLLDSTWLLAEAALEEAVGRRPAAVS